MSGLAPITTYGQLSELPRHSVVQDADGKVWCIKDVEDEIWLCPFSDEYAFFVKPNGEVYALGDTPTLPLRPLNTSCRDSG